jgi:hypothetical protein
MSYFFIGLYILLGLTAIYYVVFFALLYYWHEKKATFVVVPIIFTFYFFSIGFLVISIASLAIQYLPNFLDLVAK